MRMGLHRVLMVVLIAGMTIGGLSAAGQSFGASARLHYKHRADAKGAPFANDQTAFDFFESEGLGAVQAAGIVGNFDAESKDNPAAMQQGCTTCGVGIAQWSRGGRWDTDPNDNVTWYAGTLPGNPSPTTLMPQLEFTWYELSKFSEYGLSALESATDVSLQRSPSNLTSKSARRASVTRPRGSLTRRRICTRMETLLSCQQSLRSRPLSRLRAGP